MVAGGEDTAEVGYYVDWGIDWYQFEKALRAAKDRAAESQDDFARLDYCGRVLAVNRRGIGKGRGHCPYSFHWQGITFGLMNRPSWYGESPNVRVHYGSLPLMESAFEACHSEVVDLLKSLGGEVSGSVLSRVDVCVDLPGVDVGEFVRAVWEKRRVCRARKRSYHEEGENWTGVTVGLGGDVVCRMYDKLAECQKDERKMRVLEETRWGGRPDCASRVEFQLRREALKSAEIRSVEEYLDRRAEICAYLTDNWLRLTSTVPDRENRHQDLAESSPLWVSVGAAFQSWAGSPRGKVTRTRRKPLQASGLRKQGVGCLISAAVARAEGTILSPDDLLAVISRDVYSTLQGMNTEKVQEKKALRFYAGGPSSFGRVAV